MNGLGRCGIYTCNEIPLSHKKDKIGSSRRGAVVNESD